MWAALDGARGGAVPEGNVGGGTGMSCLGFKGGIGTASRGRRQLHGRRAGPMQLRLAERADGRRRAGGPRDGGRSRRPADGRIREGSIIVVVATDAPLLPHQLERLARRVPMGIARTGGTASNGSGDIFIAFSTANPGAAQTRGTVALTMLTNDDISPFFTATIQATEEAIVNALVAAETMTGVNGRTAVALPHDRLQQVLRKYGRLK